MNAVEKHKADAGPTQGDLRRFDLRRLVALVTKESYQALRDPSTLLIAFVLVAYFGAAFGPPPPTVRVLAWSGLVGWLLVPWAYWADRIPDPRIAESLDP